MRLASLALILCVAAAARSSAQLSNGCSKLAGTRLEGIAVSSAGEVHPDPEWSYPGSDPNRAPAVHVPFCRVVGVVHGNVGFEVWLPLSGWNHHLLSSGNGAYAGFINAPTMAGALARGYATASTDAGHRGSPLDSAWARNRVDLIEDFGYRGHHLLAVAARQIVSAFYGAAPSRALFMGCSGGGHEALAEAQRYPADYDGIIAGAPGIYFPRLAVRSFYMYWATSRIPEGTLPMEKSRMVQQAVTKACDAHDGLKDGLLSRPMECHFDYASLQCAVAKDDPSCLTAAQVKTVSVLASDVELSNGDEVYPEFAPGTLLRDPGIPPATGQVGLGFMRDFVFANPDWQMSEFNLDRDFGFAEKKLGPALEADNANLAPFADRGGKLIIYHGWADGAVSPLTSTKYFAAVGKAVGEKKEASFLRMYMVPGMEHCGGGDGPDHFGAGADMEHPIQLDPQHDLLSAMENWIDAGQAPGTIIAAHTVGSKVEYTRPLCPYPAVAAYKAGDPKQAASFACEMP